LTFADHVHHLDSFDGPRRTGERSEALAGSNAPLDLWRISGGPAIYFRTHRTLWDSAMGFDRIAAQW
jgi:hypothetical protein